MIDDFKLSNGKVVKIIQPSCSSYAHHDIDFIVTVNGHHVHECSSLGSALDFVDGMKFVDEMLNPVNLAKRKTGVWNDI